MHTHNLLQARKQNLKLDLTAKEKEIFCSLQFDNDDYVQDYQKQKALELAELYALGGEEASDKWKAAKFEAYANGSSKSSIPDSTFRTANAYDKLGWFTSTRLALVRTNRVSVECGKGFIPKTFNVGKMSVPSSIGGLSYGLELLIDLGVIIKSLVSPAQEEKNLSIGKRLKNIITKDDRHYRMLNAALWFSVNLSCIILTGGISVILNLMGMSGDVIAESYRGFADLYRHHKLLRKIENRIHDIDTTIRDHDITNKLILNKIKDIDHFERLAKKNNSTIFKDPKIISSYEALCSQRDEFEALKKERKSLLATKSLLQNKIKAVAKDRLYSVAIAITVLAGMALFFFPPAQLAIMGAFIALAAGSVFAGFCRRIWNLDSVKKTRTKIVDIFTGKKQIEENNLVVSHNLSKRSEITRQSSTASVNKAIPIKPNEEEQKPLPIASLPKFRHTSGNLFNRSIPVAKIITQNQDKRALSASF